jgi:AraC-like DNA-binding protein
MQTQKAHKHHFFELHFLLKGKMLYKVNDALVEVKSGSYLLVSPEATHKIERFSEDFIKCSLAFSVRKDAPIFSALCIKNGQVSKISSAVADSLKMCISESQKETLYSSAIIKNRICEVIYNISDLTARKKRAVTDGAYDVRLIKAKQFIEDNSHIFLRCEDIAAYCYISTKQLNRIFLKHEGVTLLQYLHISKTTLAERLLKEPTLSIQQVSERLGFSSVYYFSNFFSKHTGFTPASYRKSFV